MGGKKEKTPESEYDRVKLAKRVTDKGFAITDSNSTAAKGDIRYKATGAKGAQASASNAIAMQKRVKQSRGMGSNKLAGNSMASVKADAEQFSLTSRTGMSNVQRKAAGAKSAVRGAAQTLRTVGSIANRETGKANAEFVADNQIKQTALDGVALATVDQLGKKWDSEAIDAKRAKDSSNYLDNDGKWGGL